MANIGGLAGGAAKGLQAGQDFSQNQQMNPYLLQHQQLQNQLMQQRLQGGQAGTGFQDSIGGQGIQDVADYVRSQGQGGQGAVGAGDPSQGQGGAAGGGQTPQSSWNNLVDPLGIIQKLGLPMPQDPTTFLQSLGLPGLAFSGQAQPGGSNGSFLSSLPGLSYNSQQPGAGAPQQYQASPANYWGIGGM
jgi:hypothetical protein